MSEGINAGWGGAEDGGGRRTGRGRRAAAPRRRRTCPAREFLCLSLPPAFSLPSSLSLSPLDHGVEEPAPPISLSLSSSLSLPPSFILSPSFSRRCTTASKNLPRTRVCGVRARASATCALARARAPAAAARACRWIKAAVLAVLNFSGNHCGSPMLFRPSSAHRAHRVPPDAGCPASRFLLFEIVGVLVSVRPIQRLLFGSCCASLQRPTLAQPASDSVSAS